MKEIIVNSKYDGKKLNTFLQNTIDGISINAVYKALRKRDIRVNNIKVSENVVVHTGDNIKIYISDEQLLGKAVDIVYEDENIIVVNKPAGIEVTGNSTCLTNILIHQKQTTDIFPCHRLDRNTCGLVLFAKNEESLNILLDKFKNREIEKIYRARVYGIPKTSQKLLEAYLFKDNKKSMVYISDVPKRGYVQIQTYYKVIETNKKENTSLLEINLLTGKTHQIRAHLAHIGFPIIGDGKYGNNEINKRFHKKVQELYSYSICFKFNSPAGHLEYLNQKLITKK